MEMILLIKNFFNFLIALVFIGSLSIEAIAKSKSHDMTKVSKKVIKNKETRNSKKNKKRKKTVHILSYKKFKHMSRAKQKAYIKGLKQIALNIDKMQKRSGISYAEAGSLKGSAFSSLTDLWMAKANAYEAQSGLPCIVAGNISVTGLKDGREVCLSDPPGSDNFRCDGGGYKCNPVIYGDDLCAPNISSSTQWCTENASDVTPSESEWNTFSEGLKSYCDDQEVDGSGNDRIRNRQQGVCEMVSAQAANLNTSVGESVVEEAVSEPAVEASVDPQDALDIPNANQSSAVKSCELGNPGPFSQKCSEVFSCVSCCTQEFAGYQVSIYYEKMQSGSSITLTPVIIASKNQQKVKFWPKRNSQGKYDWTYEENSKLTSMPYEDGKALAKALMMAGDPFLYLENNEMNYMPDFAKAMNGEKIKFTNLSYRQGASTLPEATSDPSKINMEIQFQKTGNKAAQLMQVCAPEISLKSGEGASQILSSEPVSPPPPPEKPTVIKEEKIAPSNQEEPGVNLPPPQSILPPDWQQQAQ